MEVAVRLSLLTFLLISTLELSVALPQQATVVHKLETTVPPETSTTSPTTLPATTTVEVQPSVETATAVDASTGKDSAEYLECERASTSWSPWTGKWENIKDNDCGRRRRTRKLRSRDADVEEKCDRIDFRFYEFQEFCKVNNHNETTEIFQFYFVDEIFGYSAIEAETETDERRRRRRSTNGNGMLWANIFSNHRHEEESQCPDDVSKRPVDFLVLLDKSGSMSPRHFKQLIKSISFLVSNAIPTISLETTRMAMMTFANQPTIEFEFKACTSKPCVQKQIRKAKFTGGLTRMAHALDEARVVFTESRGMRSCSRRVILLITDGSGSHEHISPEVAARDLKVGKGVEIFVVGVTDLINEEQLQAIVSSPPLTHLFFMPNTKAVRKVCKRLKKAQAHE